MSKQYVGNDSTVWVSEYDEGASLFGGKLRRINTQTSRYYLGWRDWFGRQHFEQGTLTDGEWRTLVERRKAHNQIARAKADLLIAAAKLNT